MAVNVGHSLKSHMVYLGTEDKFRGKTFDENTVGDAYNWYNYFCEPKDSKEYTLIWLREKAKTQKDPVNMETLIEKIEGTKDHHFRTLGWICRLLSIGATVPKYTLEFRDRRLKELAGLETLKDPSRSKVRSVEERSADHLNDIIGEIDKEMDVFSETWMNRFKPFEFLTSKNLKQSQLKKIVSYYTPIHAELSEVVTSPDDQLKEAYRLYTKPKQKKLLEFVTKVLVDANTILESVVEEVTVKRAKNRKPRKRKVKTPEQLTGKMLYLQTADKYNATSIPPRDIVGASQLWVFNVKNRVLTSYVSTAVGGLSVKGSTILNYDKKLSIQKKLRKPEAIIKEVLEGGKVTLKRVMEGIKAVEGLGSGRINKETVLLRIVK